MILLSDKRSCLSLWLAKMSLNGTIFIHILTPKHHITPSDIYGIYDIYYKIAFQMVGISLNRIETKLLRMTVQSTVWKGLFEMETIENIWTAIYVEYIKQEINRIFLTNTPILQTMQTSCHLKLHIKIWTTIHVIRLRVNTSSYCATVLVSLL